MSTDLAPIRAFLQTATPIEWCQAAVANLDTLLLDHANCEMKAAQTALSLIYRYPEQTALCLSLSRLAREELRHFEQVQRWLDRRGIERRKLGPARYAGALLAATSDQEPDRLRQRLIVAALIEARSCERFAALLDYLPPDLEPFYRGLLESEARHFGNYLALAAPLATDNVAHHADIERLVALEAELIGRPDTALRFHSGVPTALACVDDELEAGAIPA